MPLRLPNLDDLQWKDLVAEGRSIIPALAPEWTNHNPSDPGITLMELFAYISGTLTYQLNRITDTDTAAFLSLLNGPEWSRAEDLSQSHTLDSLQYRRLLRAAVSTEEKRRTLLTLSAPMRAVTTGDFEMLTSLVPGVVRAKVLPGLNLENGGSNSRWNEKPGHISVVVLPADKANAQDVLAKVGEALEPARLLTTRVHILSPRYVKVTIRLTVIPQGNITDLTSLRKSVVDKLARFLDPNTGWSDGNGWPFGRSLYISELYQVASEVAGVYSVVPSRNAQGAVLDELVVDAGMQDRFVRNGRGEIQEFSLLPDELPGTQLRVKDISIAQHA